MSTNDGIQAAADKQPKKYVPPHLRNLMQNQGGEGAPREGMEPFNGRFAGGGSSKGGRPSKGGSGKGKGGGWNDRYPESRDGRTYSNAPSVTQKDPVPDRWAVLGEDLDSSRKGKGKGKGKGGGGGGKGKGGPSAFNFGFQSDYGYGGYDRERSGWGKGGAGAAEGEMGGKVVESADPVQRWLYRGGRSGHYHDNREHEIFEQGDRVQTGINFNDYDLIPVEVSGRHTKTIEPLLRFDDPSIGLHSSIIKNIERASYTKPTPIQKYALPIVCNGRDMMACAQTGSGKTCAFLLPVIDRMLKNGPPPAATSRGRVTNYQSFPVALILAPTRELSSQIYDEARKFTFSTGIRSVVCYGGADFKTQSNDLYRGCDILVATPGRLSDFLERGKVSLTQIQYLVFDEADRMLDMGFEPQIRGIVEQNDMPYGEDRLTAMFSATFPKDIQKLAKDFLNDYLFLTVGRVGSTNQFIKQTVRYSDERNKYFDLVRLLEDEESPGLTLIFVATKRKADEIEHKLRSKDYPATSIHGDRSQWEREEALHMFKTAALPLLVATDVAARGLDIPNVNHVINYEMPGNIEDYVHRIGRTGRAGNAGKATSFVSEDNRNILRDLWGLLDESGQEVPDWFKSLVSSTSSGGGKWGGRGGKGKKGGGYSSRDYRDYGDSHRKTFYDTRNDRDGRSGGGGGGHGHGGFGKGGGRGGQKWSSFRWRPCRPSQDCLRAPLGHLEGLDGGEGEGGRLEQQQLGLVLRGRSLVLCS